jgi:hypothetical protein
MSSIFIPGNVPSLKNGKQIVQIGKEGRRRPILVPSKTHKKYEEATAFFWKAKRGEFLEQARGLSVPLTVGFFFHRSSRRLFDYLNAIQTCEDLMVKYKWVEDDNASILLPVPIGYALNAKAPGVNIEVIPRDFIERLTNH